MKTIFAPLIWLAKKLKAEFDASAEETENETEQEWLYRQW